MEHIVFFLNKKTCSFLKFISVLCDISKSTESNIQSLNYEYIQLKNILRWFNIIINYNVAPYHFSRYQKNLTIVYILSNFRERLSKLFSTIRIYIKKDLRRNYKYM